VVKVFKNADTQYGALKIANVFLTGDEADNGASISFYQEYNFNFDA